MNTLPLNITEQGITSFEVRRKFGRVLQEVLAKGRKFIVERHGEPIAVIVPIETYQQWKQTRSAFFTAIRSTSERANLAPDEADTLVAEAVKTVRTHR